MSKQKTFLLIAVLCGSTFPFFNQLLHAQQPAGSSSQSAPPSTGDVVVTQPGEQPKGTLLPGKLDWRGRFSVWGDVVGGGSLDGGLVGQGFIEGSVYTGYDIIDHCNVTNGFVCVKFHPFLGLGGGRYIDSKASYFHFLTGGGVKVFLGKNRAFAVTSQLGFGIKATGIDDPLTQVNKDRIHPDFVKDPSERNIFASAFQLGAELDLGPLIKTKAARGCNLRAGLKFENGPGSNNPSQFGLTTDIGFYTGFRYQLPN